MTKDGVLTALKSAGRAVASTAKLALETASVAAGSLTGDVAAVAVRATHKVQQTKFLGSLLNAGIVGYVHSSDSVYRSMSKNDKGGEIGFEEARTGVLQTAVDDYCGEHAQRETHRVVEPILSEPVGV